jgi:hypothetical protein
MSALEHDPASADGGSRVSHQADALGDFARRAEHMTITIVLTVIACIGWCAMMCLWIMQADPVRRP